MKNKNRFIGGAIEREDFIEHIDNMYYKQPHKHTSNLLKYLKAYANQKASDIQDFNTLIDILIEKEEEREKHRKEARQKNINAIYKVYKDIKEELD